MEGGVGCVWEDRLILGVGCAVGVVVVCCVKERNLSEDLSYWILLLYFSSSVWSYSCLTCLVASGCSVLTLLPFFVCARER